MKIEPDLDFFLENSPLPLNTCPGWPKPAMHFFDRQQAIAILAARKINRPLLVRGEPGCGKTQLARAAAQVLRMPMVCLAVNERTEAEDVKWHYDALRRLSDANCRQGGVCEEEAYLSAGPLWWALNHTSAQQYQGHHCSQPYLGNNKDDQRDFANGVLLLIDEIDKADRSVPNSLLEAMGNFSFSVPYINRQVQCADGQEPLIIITSNGEQELPAAFIRRCLVLDLKLDTKDEHAFVDALTQRGLALDIGFDQATIEAVASLLWEKRKAAEQANARILPGQAEFFDHLEAIRAMRGFAKKVRLEDAMEELASLTYEKN
jgi:MoxR-like ATPase